MKGMMGFAKMGGCNTHSSLDQQESGLQSPAVYYTIQPFGLEFSCCHHSGLIQDIKPPLITAYRMHMAKQGALHLHAHQFCSSIN